MLPRINFFASGSLVFSSPYFFIILFLVKNWTKKKVWSNFWNPKHCSLLTLPCQIGVAAFCYQDKICYHYFQGSRRVRTWNRECLMRALFPKTHKPIQNSCNFSHLAKWIFNLCKLLPNYFLELVVLSEKKQNLAKQALSYYAWKIAISQQLIHSNGVCRKKCLCRHRAGDGQEDLRPIFWFNENKGFFEKHSCKAAKAR